MELLTTRNFNGIELQCYRNVTDNEDFWATREQIGQLLGYHDPMRTIAKIHKRNKDRLDKFSSVVNLSTVEGNRTVFREMTVYNFKGLLEICRYSNQPKANAVIDFLWDVADDIRKHGMYLSDRAIETLKHDPETFQKLMARYLATKDENEVLRKQVNENAPYATLGRMVLALPESIPVADAAQFLAQHGIPMGRNRLYEYGREQKLLSKQKGRWNKPTQKGIEQGLVNLELDTAAFKFSTRTMITPKGLKNIFDALLKEYYPLEELYKQAEDE